jgi:hypothetical protein
MFEKITGTLYNIPSFVIYAKMSPPGMEAAGYGKYINCLGIAFFLDACVLILSTIVPLSICPRTF